MRASEHQSINTMNMMMWTCGNMRGMDMMDGTVFCDAHKYLVSNL